MCSRSMCIAKNLFFPQRPCPAHCLSINALQTGSDYDRSEMFPEYYIFVNDGET